MSVRLLLLPTLLFFALSSCEKEEEPIAPQEAEISTGFLVDENEDGQVAVPDLGFQEPIEKHVDGHTANYADAERVTRLRPDGTEETLYLVDDDIELTKDQLRELQAMDAALEKQYRTNNLVSDNYITVIGYTGGSNALTSKMRTALSWAIDNYNALNTNKTFSLSFSASTNADIVVYRVSNSGAGGSAGFPSGGRPYKWVQIYSGMSNYDTNTNEHVMTHEIGHCMGMRHTDYVDRRSCGAGGGESAGSTGAVLVPGTPSGYDPNSIMLSCFGSGEDGEFGYYDRVALEYLY
ncbi:M57 family metalloprotease [Lewinella sp. IMCC34191]|uniref:M57 family metalloprotease n=1 Tax=Lewinella sp. IMCC34191 TaxID=2259172 RepID=UPI000E243E54|nr:M57 family metalloprotease [Lewinella sp. IMCC34191]